MNKLNDDMCDILSKFSMPDKIIAALWQKINGNRSLSNMSQGTSFEIGWTTEPRLRDCRRLAADGF